MSSTVLTRVMLVDDHEIMRDGLREVLERSGDFEVVGEAGDGDSAVREAQNLKPDVIIMDVMMPLKDGIEACREITDVLPETKVLILTASSEEDAVVESFAAGATGYLQKYSGKEHLLRTARDVARGEYRIPKDVVKRAFSGIRFEFRAGQSARDHQADRPGTGDSDTVQPGTDIRRNRRCQGQQVGNYPERG